MSVKAGTDFYRTQKIIDRGMKAGSDMGCCSCETTDTAIVTTCMIAGGVIGGVASIPAGGVGAIPGVVGGCVVGIAIVNVRKAIRNGECNIL